MGNTDWSAAQFSKRLSDCFVGDTSVLRILDVRDLRWYYVRGPPSTIENVQRSKHGR